LVKLLFYWKGVSSAQPHVLCMNLRTFPSLNFLVIDDLQLTTIVFCGSSVVAKVLSASVVKSIFVVGLPFCSMVGSLLGRVKQRNDHGRVRSGEVTEALLGHEKCVCFLGGPLFWEILERSAGPIQWVKEAKDKGEESNGGATDSKQDGVFPQGGHFSGIYRKVQLKPLQWVKEVNDKGEEVEKVTEALLILKYGGVLTHAGRQQAESLGKDFRNNMYPGMVVSCLLFRVPCLLLRSQ
jgi:hypothetical protein